VGDHRGAEQGTKSLNCGWALGHQTILPHRAAAIPV
jgi:hypothetical protein